jgi:hypothetical protein
MYIKNVHEYSMYMKIHICEHVHEQYRNMYKYMYIYI